MMFTPVQRQQHSSTMVIIAVPGCLSHLIGLMPRVCSTWLAMAVSISEKISLKMMPATTTEVSAGMNSTLRKNDPRGMRLLFRIVAKSMGNGTSSSSVMIV